MKENVKGYLMGIFVLILAVGIIAGGVFMQSRIHDVKASYQTELSKSQVLNQSAQQNVSNLIEENARLRGELAAVTGDIESAVSSAQNEELKRYKVSFSEFAEVWALYKAKDIKAAKEKYRVISRSSLDENAAMMYDMLGELMK